MRRRESRTSYELVEASYEPRLVLDANQYKLSSNWLIRRDARGRALGTTHNAQRVHTIDHVYHDADRLDLLARSSLLAPEEGAPNGEHPSDHMPIVAQYALRRRLRVGGVELPYQP